MSLDFDSYALGSVDRGKKTGEGNPGICFALWERNCAHGKNSEKSNIESKKG